MAAEAAYDSWGLRYAPPDPTLPEHWKCLIDGGSGLMYYWNLVTNITQYEKPTAVSEPVSAPPGTEQPNGNLFQQMPPQQGNNILPQPYQGVDMEQSQSYQFAHNQSSHYLGYQQWPPQQQDNRVQASPTQFCGSQFNVQQPLPFGQLKQKGVDCRQHGQKLQNQMLNIPLVGLEIGFEDHPPRTSGNDHCFNDKNGGLAASPMAKIDPEMKSGDRVHQNVEANGGTPPMKNAMTSANQTVAVSTDAMSQSSVDIYCKKDGVTATGDNVPAPFMSFESTGFPPEILREIYAADFASPTPIQAQTWPIALQNRDIVAIAKTGSGKTLGYLIPAFMLLRRCNNNRQHGPTVVVLSPTRELATQIQDEAIKFGRSVRISCSCLYCEAPKGPQLKDLERGVDIIVATPGRLNDILEMRKVDFGQVSLLVLDEADRMLDMGFEPQIRKIVNEIPPHRQTLMYTTTWPEEVRKIAGDLLVNPVQVNIGNADELAANKCITQDCKHSTDLIKADEADQPVPREVREIVTRDGPGFGKDRGEMGHTGSGGGSGGYIQDVRFGGGSDLKDRRFSGRGDLKGGGFRGRGGGFGGRGGQRDDGFGGCVGSRGVGIGGQDGGWGRNNRFKDSCGRGRGHGRGRFDNNKDSAGSRGRGYSFSCSRSRGRSCSRSWSHSRSPRRNRSRTPVRRERRSRSLSRSPSPRQSKSRTPVRRGGRSRSWGRSQSRSPRRGRSRTPVRRERWSRSWSRSLSCSRSRSRTPVRRVRRSRSRSRSYSRGWTRSRSPRRSRSRTPVRRQESKI